VEPSKEAPDEGMIRFYLDSAHETRKHTLEEYTRQKQQIISTLQTLLINSQGLDTKSLCIKPAIYCWLVHIDLLVLQSISLRQVDLLAGATKAALGDVQFPKVRVVFNENTKTYDYEVLEEMLTWKDVCKTPIPDIVTLGLVFFYLYY